MFRQIWPSLGEAVKIVYNIRQHIYFLYFHVKNFSSLSMRNSWASILVILDARGVLER